MDALRGLAKFDTFGKSKEHVQVRTLSGATVSLIAGAFMLLLFISEVRYWRSLRVEDHLLVDTSQGDREFDVAMDIDFHALSCREVNIACEDAKGIPYEEGRFNLQRYPTAAGADPNIKRSIFSNPRVPAPGSDKPGCRVVGTIRVRKVAGVFYIAAPRTLTNVDGRLAFTISPEVMASFNVSHTINKLSFGPWFPNQVSPLDGVVTPPQPSTAAFQYHLRVVPTLYQYLYGTMVDSQQYSASDFVQVFEPNAGGFIHPGAWWKYDFSPIMVRMIETRRPFLQFIVSLCAILGGVFAISGIVDQVFYRAMESRKVK